MLPHFGGSPAAGALDKMGACGTAVSGLEIDARSTRYSANRRQPPPGPSPLSGPDFAPLSRLTAQTGGWRTPISRKHLAKVMRKRKPWSPPTAGNDCNVRKTVVIVAALSRTSPTRHASKRDEAPDGSPVPQRRGRLGWVAFLLGRARAGNPGPRRGRRSKRWLRDYQVFLFKALAPCD